jgi:hypothetical protein
MRLAAICQHSTARIVQTAEKNGAPSLCPTKQAALPFPYMCLLVTMSHVGRCHEHALATARVTHVDSAIRGSNTPCRNGSTVVRFNCGDSACSVSHKL